MLEVLDAPHFGLPNCEVARLRFHASFRWEQARVLVNAFHEAQPLQILIDADSP